MCASAEETVEQRRHQVELIAHRHNHSAVRLKSHQMELSLFLLHLVSHTEGRQSREQEH